MVAVYPEAAQAQVEWAKVLADDGIRQACGQIVIKSVSP